MLHTTHLQLFSMTATLHDHPMTIPMTAAASDTHDDERPQSHSYSAISEEITPDITPPAIFLQTWNAFYSKLIWSTTYQAINSTSAPFNLNIVKDDAINQAPCTQQAATSDADDDEQPWSHSYSVLLEEITPEITPIFLPMWNAFYEFVQSTTYQMMTTTPAPSDFNIVNNNAIQTPCTQQSLHKATTTPTLNQISPSAYMHESDNKVCHRDQTSSHL